MNSLKIYLTRMIAHAEYRTRQEEQKIREARELGIEPIKTQLHYLDGMHEALTTVLKHIEEMENDL